jgi:hypothetical protein
MGHVGQPEKEMEADSDRRATFLGVLTEVPESRVCLARAAPPM